MWLEQTARQRKYRARFVKVDATMPRFSAFSSSRLPMRPCFLLIFPLFLLTACLTPKTGPGIPDQSPSATVTRQEVLAIAEAYRAHPWRPTQANIRHGTDARGIRVDTPDAGFQPAGGTTRPGWWQPDQWNHGVPYQWGGFDTLKEFDREVAKGRAAGDIYTQAKRDALDDAVSAEACGIDCSGFISRCWRLEKSWSTREITALCDPLPSYQDLLPGDILNVHNSHVVIFAGWKDEKHTVMNVYETGSPPTWKVLYRDIRNSFLKERGYAPWRYKGIRG